MTRTLIGKISIVYVGLVFLIAVVGFAGFFNLYKMEKAVDNLMTNNYKSISAITKMLEAIERQNEAILMHVSMDRHKGMDLYTENYATFIKWFHVEENNITEEGEKKLVEALNRKYGNYIRLFSQLQEIRDGKGEAAAISYYDKTIMPVFYEIKQSLTGLADLNEKALFKSKEVAAKKAKQSMYFLLGLSLTAVAGGYGVSRYFVYKFLSPLNKLAESISKVKIGELNQQLDIQSDDETGKLAREFNEMTQRLQVYEKSTLGTLMAEKNKSMAIVKSISNPLIVLDANYRIVLLNNACENFFNINETNTTGRHFLEVIRNGEIFDHISATVESNEEHREKIIYINDETNYYFNVVVTAVKDPERKNTGLIVAFQDVTELKEIERVKTDFIATISHEFKTPLTSIIMATSMLEEGGMGALNSEQKEIVETLKEDGERLSNLVSELIELSRIESGNAVYKLEPCSVNTVAEVSIKEFIEAAEKKKIILTNNMDEGLPLVNADFEKIHWVMNNLINNALKYTKAGNYIAVSSRVDRDYVYITVKDTGTGIPPEYIDSIFDKFVQVKDRDIEVRGTGLGLSVAKEIVNAHKGEIWVKSELDIGSSFTFKLPVLKTEVGK